MSYDLNFRISGQTPYFALVDIDGLYPFHCFWTRAPSERDAYQDQGQIDE